MVKFYIKTCDQLSRLNDNIWILQIDSGFILSSLISASTKIYYGSAVWLTNFSASYVKRLESVHYLALNIACGDYKSKMGRDILDPDLHRATTRDFSAMHVSIKWNEVWCKTNCLFNNFTHVCYKTWCHSFGVQASWLCEKPHILPPVHYRIKSKTGHNCKAKNEQTLGENKINGLWQNTRIVILLKCLRQKYNTKEILHLIK
jgi:hypothetical protein